LDSIFWLDSSLKLYCAATFQVLFIVLQYCAWNITAVEMNSGVYLLKSTFVYFRWFWSWSCCFGLDLGLVSSNLGSWSHDYGFGRKNLVLFTLLFKAAVRNRRHGKSGTNK